MRKGRQPPNLTLANIACHCLKKNVNTYHNYTLQVVVIIGAQNCPAAAPQLVRGERKKLKLWGVRHQKREFRRKGSIYTGGEKEEKAVVCVKTKQ